ncbi:MAG: flagellar hook-associated protein FlgK, partial [Inhella sp.]
MGASLLLTLGARAMNASQTAINTIGHNIANANTPGYSRQSAVLKTAAPQFTGGGFQGKGVQVDTITRAYNQFLSREATTSRSTAVSDLTLLNNLQRLERVLPPGEAGLGQGMSQFLNAMVDVSSRPSDTAARQVVLARAQEMAARFASAGQQLQDLQQGVVTELKANAVVVNQLAKQIATLNGDIARLTGSDNSPNDLLDQRDQLVAELAKYIGVSTIPASDGSVGVFIGGGQVLVLGSQARSLV